MADGTQTSEFKLTVVAQVLGAILEAASVALHTLGDAGLGGSIVSVALVVVGVLLQIATLMGYQKARTMVKVAEQNTKSAEAYASASSAVSVQSPK